MIINSDQLPVGFRFMPTDEELVTHYLMNKVFHRPVPAAQEIREIDAAGFYGGHPKNLVTFSCGEREWFFFIHQSESSHASQRRSIRVVGNGLGFWKPNGSEDPICDEDGNAFASKVSLTYFSRTSSLSHAKRTHWKTVEYYLHEHDHVESNAEEKYQEDPPSPKLSSAFFFCSLLLYLLWLHQQASSQFFFSSHAMWRDYSNVA